MLFCLCLTLIAQIPNNTSPEFSIDLPEFDFGSVFDEHEVQLFDIDKYLLNYLGKPPSPILTFDFNAWLNAQLRFPDHAFTLKFPEFQRTVQYGNITIHMTTRFFPDVQEDPTIFLNSSSFQWFGNLFIFYRGLELHGSYQLAHFDLNMWQYSLQLRRNF